MEDFLTFRTNAKVVTVDPASPIEPLIYIGDGLHYPITNKHWKDYAGLIFQPLFADFYPVAIHMLFATCVALVQIHFLILANISAPHRLISVLLLAPLFAYMALRIFFCLVRYQSVAALAFWQIMFDLVSAGWACMTGLFVLSLSSGEMWQWFLLALPFVSLLVHPAHSALHPFKADGVLSVSLLLVWWDLFAANPSLLLLTVAFVSVTVSRYFVASWRLAHQLVLDAVRWSLHLSATLTILHLWFAVSL